MDDRAHRIQSKQVQGMLDLMLCLPRSAWGLVLEKVSKKIGAVALRKIILLACDESGAHMLEGLKRGVAVFNRENKAQPQRQDVKRRVKQ